MAKRGNALTVDIFKCEIKKLKHEFCESFTVLKNSISDEISQLRAEFQTLQSAMPELTKMEVKKQLQEVQVHIDESIQFSVGCELEKQISEIQKQIDCLKAQQESQLKLSENNASYSYNFNVLLHGIQESPGREDCLDVVKSKLIELGVDHQILADLEGTAHRLGKERTSNSKPRPIVFKMMRRPSKDTIISLSKEKFSNQIVAPYFSRHLPPFIAHKTRRSRTTIAT